MKKLKQRIFAVLSIVTGLMLLTLAGCAGKWNTMDAAGLSLAEIKKMSLEEQYRLLGERFGRMEELLTEAQIAVSDEEWNWRDIGQVGAGTYGPEVLSGSTAENSYYLSTTRSIHLKDAEGDISDLDPMLKHFEANDWEAAVTSSIEISVDHEARAVTDDGWHVWYTVQENGQYNLSVVSNPFWGDEKDLQKAKTDRMSDRGPGVSVPGVLPPFPDWDDPIVRG